MHGVANVPERVTHWATVQGGGPECWVASQVGVLKLGSLRVIARSLSMSASEKRRPLPSLGTSGYLPVAKRERTASGQTLRSGHKSPVR